MKEPIVQIFGVPEEGVHCEPDYWRAIAARDKCPDCGVQAPLKRKSDDPIPVFEGSRSFVAPVWSIQPYLVARVLYAAMREHLPPHWTWSVIPDRRSATIDPVGVLVRPKHMPLAHCQGHVPTRCARCEMVKYAKGTPTYVVRRDLPKFAITMTRGLGLVAEEAIARSLQRKFPRRLGIDRIEVRDTAPEAVHTLRRTKV